jgi:hypothetical protein
MASSEFAKFRICGEPLWLSGKVVKMRKINEIERTRVRSPPSTHPRATSFFKKSSELAKLRSCLVQILKYI